MLNIVFVDDELDLCELYEEIFSTPDVLVKSFNNLSEAEVYINNNPVSLAFIDYRMPSQSGVEFRKKLSPLLPCYLVTGEFLNEELQGFKKILSKPLKQEVFDAILKNHGIPTVLDSKYLDPYRALFANLPQEVHIWKIVRNPNGRIKTWILFDANPVALNAWGKKLEDVVGRTTEEIFPNVNAVETFMPIVEKIFADGKPYDWQEYFEGTDQLLGMKSIPCGEYFISLGGDKNLK